VRRPILLSSVILILGSVFSGCAKEKTNVLFILVDDLGWSDLGSYGHPWHETPRIDSLAKEGMRFTQAYAPAPICSASRASILTGKTPARLGLEFVVKAEPGEQVIEPPQSHKAPPFTLSLNLEETTIAEHLLTADYETAYYGKWHLNPHYNGVYNGWSPTHGPGQQGFTIAEEDFGSHPYSKRELVEISKQGSYHPDGITEKAINYLKQDHRSPFFLMVSHFYVHTPIQSPYSWLLKKYDKIIPQGVAKRNRRVEYAAFLETLDHYVGELLDGLEESGNADSTLVVFFSDNGGHPEYVSNKPLRGSKWNLYEGGIRVPMLVRWPGKVSPGSICEEAVIGYDLFPTFAEVAGNDIEENRREMDGKSLLSLFEGSAPEQTRNLYWHFPYYHPEGKKFGEALGSIGIDDFEVSQTRPHSAIRQGDYKLIYFDEDKRSELYNLRKDLSEKLDVSKDHFKVAQSLEQQLLDYLNQVNARRALPNRL
jgi:arylsulfatase A-like enzyme